MPSFDSYKRLHSFASDKEIRNFSSNSLTRAMTIMCIERVLQGMTLQAPVWQYSPIHPGRQTLDAFGEHVKWPNLSSRGVHLSEHPVP